MFLAQLDSAVWAFDEIARSEPDRAVALESADTPEALKRLIESLEAALQHATANRDVRLGRERVGTGADDFRAVVQFPVGEELFDWFFNGRTGYRAHFRVHYKCGLRFNNRIEETLLRVLIAGLPEVAVGRELDCDCKDLGETAISRIFVTRSLAPYVTKLWMCFKRIKKGGGTDCLPSGLIGPTLIVNGNYWLAPYRHNEDAWLEIKGGFVGRKAYQRKPPFTRARELHKSGKA